MYKTLNILLVLSILIPVIAKAQQKFAAIVLNPDNHKIIYQRDAREYRYPASLAKLMTLYLTFDALEKKKIHWKQKLFISKHAAAQPPSKLDLHRGSCITVRDAVLSVIVRSANDSAVVLAEAIAHSEVRFAKMMNYQARKLHMYKSFFVNASGLHHARQRVSAYDMVKLALALRHRFSKFYTLFSRSTFTYHHKVLHTTNKLLTTYQGIDGLKTGYTSKAGFNLITSAHQAQHELIAVVMGSSSVETRNHTMTKLLNLGFTKLRHKQEEMPFLHLVLRHKPQYIVIR